MVIFDVSTMESTLIVKIQVLYQGTVLWYKGTGPQNRPLALSFR